MRERAVPFVTASPLLLFITQRARRLGHHERRSPNKTFEFGAEVHHSTTCGWRYRQLYDGGAAGNAPASGA
jgi:hypothetical protein